MSVLPEQLATKAAQFLGAAEAAATRSSVRSVVTYLPSPLVWARRLTHRVRHEKAGDWLLHPKGIGLDGIG